MVTGPTRHQQVYLVSGMSLFLYSIVAFISAYYYYKFKLITLSKEKQDITSLNYLQSIGRFDEAKRNFFFILMISSTLELPNYIGCLAEDGPPSCEWSSISNLVFWFFHLIALCGYVICIIIPCVLWSDMINKKDGKLIFSNYKYDNVKRFFRVLIILYCFNLFINILTCCIYYRLSDREYYYRAPTYTVCSLVESILSLLISLGCSYCGIKLQVYVIQAKLRSTVELRFLFTLNIILVVVLLALLGRAILIFGISAVAPGSFERGISYTVFTLVSRWLPDVFCPLCLIYIMRYSGDEIMKKNKLPLAVKVHTESNDVSKTLSNKLLNIQLSNDYDIETIQDNPSIILVKELSEQTIEKLQAQSRALRIESNDNPRASSVVSSPNDYLFQSFSPRRLYESNEIENPISYLVHIEEKSETTTPSKQEHFSTDSIHSRPGDFRASLDDAEL